MDEIVRSVRNRWVWVWVWVRVWVWVLEWVQVQVQVLVVFFCVAFRNAARGVCVCACVQDVATLQPRHAVAAPLSFSHSPSNVHPNG